jgi:hypothetical protein
VRTIGVCIALLTGLAAGATAQAVETPEQVAGQFVDAMRAGNWGGMAHWMHPDALHQMRSLLQPLFESNEADDVRQQILGNPSKTDATAMSDSAVFAALMQIMIQQEPSVVTALRSAQVQMLGHVAEGQDTVHVVYRMTMTIEGLTISRMDVFSLAHAPAGWRGLLKGDFSALASAIRAAIDHRSD